MPRQREAVRLVSMGEPGSGESFERRHSTQARGVRRFFQRLASSRGELEAEELREDAEEVGATPIGECAERARVRVFGTLRTVTLQPRGGVPAVEAELYDGSGVIDIVWLGRRRIAGIEPGRTLQVHGLVTEQEGRKLMFNPRYELWPQESQ